MDASPNRLLIPQDLDAEAALLGSIMTCQNGSAWDQDWTLDEIVSRLAPEMFVGPDHAAIYRALAEIVADGGPVDLLLTLPLLAGDVSHDRDGWITELVRLSESVPTWVNAPHYAHRVLEKHRLRCLQRIAQRITDALNGDAEIDATEFVGRVADEVGKLEQAGLEQREPVEVVELLRQMPTPAATVAQRVPIAPHSLNYALDGGLERGTLTVVGARPSCGKTSLGLGWCTHACHVDGGAPALFVSCEMSGPQVARRLFAMHAQVDMTWLADPGANAIDFDLARQRAVNVAASSRPMYVLDGVRQVQAIGGCVKRAVRKWGVKLVVVDYLQRCSIAGRFARADQQIGAMAKYWKDLAQDGDLALVLLSQFSRASAKDGREPRLDDFRESGQIEEEADNAILIKRGKDESGPFAETNIIVAKHRQGRTGKLTLLYHRPTMTYQAMAAESGV